MFSFVWGRLNYVILMLQGDPFSCCVWLPHQSDTSSNSHRSTNLLYCTIRHALSGWFEYTYYIELSLTKMCYFSVIYIFYN